MGIFTTILNILGLVQTDLPFIEKLLAPIGDALGIVFSKLFGADAKVKLDDAMQEGEAAVKWAEDNVPLIAGDIAATYATLQDFLATNPWLVKQFGASKQLMEAQGIDRGSANKLVERGHAVKAAAAELGPVPKP